MARSMLNSKKMPKEFWAEAVDCVVYLSNCSPNRRIWNKTPQQAWNGRKPSFFTFESIWKHSTCSCTKSEAIKVRWQE